MAGDGRADGGPAEANQSLGPAWQSYRGIYDVPGRLGKSATIALILSPVGFILVSVARLLIVSDYNPVTASAIVSSGGYVDTLLGTVIPLLPIFLPYIALIFLFFNRVIPAIFAFVAAAFVSPIAINRSSALGLMHKAWHMTIHHNTLLIAIMILLAAAFAVLLLVELTQLGFDIAFRTVATSVCVLLIPFVVRLYPLPLNNEFYAEQIKQPWLPSETITLSSGRNFTGYVLADDGAWLVVLRNDSRMVIYYPSAEVTSRKACRIGPIALEQPLITFFPTGLNAPTHTPSCEVSSTGPPGSAVHRKITHPTCQKVNQEFYLRCLEALGRSRR
jgi:hypothetical protein